MKIADTNTGKRNRLVHRASSFHVRRLIASPRKRKYRVKVNGVHLLNQFLITLADKINAYKQKNSASEFFHQHYLFRLSVTPSLFYIYGANCLSSLVFDSSKSVSSSSSSSSVNHLSFRVEEISSCSLS